MSKNFNLYFVLALVLLFGCEHPRALNRNSGLLTEFFVADQTGVKTTIFNIGEDIHFNYSITNETPETQNYFNPDTGPFVTFEVFQADSLVGTFNDGFGYFPVIVEGSLQAGESISCDYNLHNPLPAGEYTAWAKPRLHFSDIEIPSPEKIDFNITCDTTNCSSDSLNLVIITDQSPDSIQLDPFVLKSISILGDTLTLNISHSGGCKEHSYTLYMSPATFLESFPVQANLYLQHDSKGDACEALINTNISFNLRPIADLYQDFYGQQDEIF